MMHIQILGRKKGFEIDHANRDPLDNRIGNLRFCTHQQNMMNCKTPKSNKHGYRGIRYLKDKLTGKKWESRIFFKRKAYHCGTFSTKEEAAAAYNKKAIELCGEFAVLNKLT